MNSVPANYKDRLVRVDGLPDGRSRPLVERFWSRVARSGPNDCWAWLGGIHVGGHGMLSVNGETVGAHRFAYALLVGPIPEAMTIDHLCHNTDPVCTGGTSCPHRRCVNPRHLEAVTLLENVMRGKGITARAARQTHCKRGHPFTPDNIRWLASGSRACKECRRQRWREHRE